MKIKVLSWNIWCGTYLEEVVDFLRSADADIIALQEVVEGKDGNIAEIIAKKLGYEYSHAVGMDLPLRFLPGHKDEEGSVKFGNAILSKYPIVSSKVCELSAEESRLAAQADIDVHGEILHVFSIHLKHTHQKPLALQDKQAEVLIGMVPSDKTLVMGDFNALPESSVIEKMRNVMQVADKDAASTWSVYRDGCTVCLVGDVKYTLDYIFTSKDIKSELFEVRTSKGSDHLPISTVIEI